MVGRCSALVGGCVSTCRCANETFTRLSLQSATSRVHTGNTGNICPCFSELQNTVGSKEPCWFLEHKSKNAISPNCTKCPLLGTPTDAQKCFFSKVTLYWPPPPRTLIRSKSWRTWFLQGNQFLTAMDSLALSMEMALNQRVEIRVSYGGGGGMGSPITNVITRAVVCGSSLQQDQSVINLGQQDVHLILRRQHPSPPPRCCCLLPKGQTPGLVIPRHPRITWGGGLPRSIPVNGYAHMKGVGAQIERERVWVGGSIRSAQTCCRKYICQD